MLLNNLGNHRAEMLDYSGAMRALKSALKLRTRMATKNPKKFNHTVAMTWGNIGVVQQDHHQVSAAQHSFKKADEIYQELADSNPDMFLPEVAIASYNLGTLYQDVNDPRAAEMKLQRSCNIFRQLCNSGRDYLMKFVMSLNALAATKAEMNQRAQAKQLFIEANEVLSRIKVQSSVDILIERALLKGNLGGLLRVMNDDDAITTFTEANAIWKKLNRRKPRTYFHFWAINLNNTGLYYLDKEDFLNAARMLNKSLTIRRKLAKGHPDLYLADLGESLTNCGNLFLELRKFKKAERNYREALGIYESLCKLSREKFLADVAMCLHNLGLLYNRSGNFKSAEHYYKSALKLYKIMARQSPDSALPDVAMCSISIAELYQQCDLREKSLTMILICLQAISDSLSTNLLTNWLQESIRLLKANDIDSIEFVEKHFGADSALLDAVQKVGLL
jgi:tetratricopeptide (TPR) repeat protein